MRDPVPRLHPLPYQPATWPDGVQHSLVPRGQPLAVDLTELLERRQTRRDFHVTVDEETLGEFFWLACRNRGSRPSPFGVDQEFRVHPSAGAMHPIHVLICKEIGPWMRYDPIGHAFFELASSENSANAAREAAGNLLDLERGVLIGLVSEPGKTSAKYENYETLVWRDAGIVHGYMSLISEALNLTFCPLGITGQPYLTDYLPQASQFQALGLAVLGRAGVVSS